MKDSILIAALLAISIPAQAGPFGLDMGTPLVELNKQMKLKLVSTGVYSTPSVPKGHPDYDDYRLIVAPAQGLCKIYAFSKVISTSVYGTELVDKFSGFESALSTKYGQPEKFDLLRSGSIWKERQDWMVGLLKKERMLVSYWPKKARDLPESIYAIQLKAVAISTEEARVTLGYEFKNFDQCRDSLKAQIDSAL